MARNQLIAMLHPWNWLTTKDEWAGAAPSDAVDGATNGTWGDTTGGTTYGAEDNLLTYVGGGYVTTK